LKELGAKGAMGDLDDSPVQVPLEEEEIEQTIVDLLPVMPYDLVITHSPMGEYTRHLRHEETGKAVIRLWNSGSINTDELWMFAYEDGGMKYYPKSIQTNLVFQLDTSTWKKKFRLMTETYGFNENTWEAHTTPRTEAFWKFTNPDDAIQWLDSQSNP
jgi:LmbE family N-acetylglucosaminyl deacetylase